jgi:hypothetical protein
MSLQEGKASDEDLVHSAVFKASVVTTSSEMANNTGYSVQ